MIKQNLDQNRSRQTNSSLYIKISKEGVKTEG